MTSSCSQHLLTQALSRFFQQTPSVHTWYVACSGGKDSTALVHCVAAVLPKHQWRIIHVNHHLHDHAIHGQQAVEKLSQQYQVPLIIENLSLAKPYKNLEERARIGRYQAFDQHVQPHEGLLLAHHENDQHETMIYRLLRGCGIQGITSMQSLTPHPSGWTIGRPWLNIPQATLIDYLQQNKWHFEQDPSNDDLSWDRNKIRHRILPAIQAHWQRPIAPALTRFIHHAHETQSLLNELAAMDYQQIKHPSHPCLRLPLLQEKSEARQTLVIRYWLRQQPILPPPLRQLTTFLQQVNDAQPDRHPSLSWQNWTLQRYQQGLWLHPNNPPTYKGFFTQGQGLHLTHTYQMYRRIDDLSHLSHRSRKALWHTHRIPPWQRHTLPLIFHGRDLVYIPGFFLAPHFQCPKNAWGWQIKLVNT